MDTIKAGDLVQLKSGGPVMTVTYISDRGKADCSWFVVTELKEASFNLPALELAKTLKDDK